MACDGERERGRGRRVGIAEREQDGARAAEHEILGQLTHVHRREALRVTRRDLHGGGRLDGDATLLDVGALDVRDGRAHVGLTGGAHALPAQLDAHVALHLLREPEVHHRMARRVLHAMLTQRGRRHLERARAIGQRDRELPTSRARRTLRRPSW